MVSRTKRPAEPSAPTIKDQQIIKPGKLLTSTDLARVTTIIEQATADNTREAYRKDLAYLWAWAAMAIGMDPTYPVSVDALIKFILDHSGTMDAEVDQVLVDAKIKQRLGPTVSPRSRAGFPRFPWPTGSRGSRTRITHAGLSR